MEVLFSASVAKDFAHPEQNDDAFVVSEDASRIALSDGASESYDSRTWARLLVERFVRDPRLGPAWVRAAAAEYATRYDGKALSWSQQAALDRGSFATLLGIVSSPGTIRVTAIGDTTVVLLDGRSLVASFPYTAPEEFRARPELFSTSSRLNGFFTSAVRRHRSRRAWPTEGLADLVLLGMTDALAEWALRRAATGRAVWAELREVRSQSELAALVERERAARAMRVDDVTLVTALTR